MTQILYALVQNNTIQQLWADNSSAAPLAAGYVPTTGWTGPIVVGATVNGAVCTAPPPIVPASISMVQARAALFASPKVAAGPTLLDDANAAVASIGGAAVIAWQYSTQIERHSPTMAAVQARLGLTDAQVDALFVAAAGIQF